MNKLVILCLAIGLLSSKSAAAPNENERPRAREAGVEVGIFDTGEFNAITDVDGVVVGHSTVNRGDDIRSGVTAIIPAPGRSFSSAASSASAGGDKNINNVISMASLRVIPLLRDHQK